MSYRCPECPVTGSKSNVRAHQLLEAHFGEPMPTKKPTDLQVLAAKYIEAVEQWKVLDAQEPTPSKDGSLMPDIDVLRPNGGTRPTSGSISNVGADWPDGLASRQGDTRG